MTACTCSTTDSLPAVVGTLDGGYGAEKAWLPLSLSGAHRTTGEGLERMWAVNGGIQAQVWDTLLTFTRQKNKKKVSSRLGSSNGMRKVTSNMKSVCDQRQDDDRCHIKVHQHSTCRHRVGGRASDMSRLSRHPNVQTSTLLSSSK